MALMQIRNQKPRLLELMMPEGQRSLWESKFQRNPIGLRVRLDFPQTGTTMRKNLIQGEFNQGLGPMLSVRGEGILLWIGNDNFVVEDKTAATHEASFLSLNLHALAEQLAKIDLSRRLFIEANLLPPELVCLIFHCDVENYLVTL
ncbi:hypothetical protein RGQ29_027976 [Quercus rubra]|uniref:Uncharacterized protein n=1 Tax=Quercus rubra TaxID=3512 RepID=A0AAN7EQX9_QUERU|nr:hypothetical protein RGQ29_027976 [Quercus rubra]